CRPMSSTWAMDPCDSLTSVLASLTKRSTNSPSSARWGRIFLITQNFSKPCGPSIRARKISPIPPVAMGATSVYRPKGIGLNGRSPRAWFWTVITAAGAWGRIELQLRTRHHCRTPGLPRARPGHGGYVLLHHLEHRDLFPPRL